MIFSTMSLWEDPYGVRTPNEEVVLELTCSVGAMHRSLSSDRQRPPETGVNSWRDSVRVKRVWGEWKTELA